MENNGLTGVRFHRIFCYDLHRFYGKVLQIIPGCQTTLSRNSIKMKDQLYAVVDTFKFLFLPGFSLTKSNTPWLILPNEKSSSLLFDVKS